MDWLKFDARRDLKLECAQQALEPDAEEPYCQNMSAYAGVKDTVFESGGTPEALERAIQQPSATLEQLQTIHDALKQRAPGDLLEDPGWVFICVVDHRLADLQLLQLTVLQLAGHPLAVRTVVIHADLHHTLHSRAGDLQRRFAALNDHLSNQGMAI